MQHLNLNRFASDVHQNAVAHGWWDEERSPGTIRALFHAELSEALEEYRAHRPMLWHECQNTLDPCMQDGCDDWFDGKCELNELDPKPEGIAVELMDFVIRVLDYLCRTEYTFPQTMCEPETLAAWSVDDFQMDMEGGVVDLDLPDLVDVLHSEIALSDVMHNETYLVTAIGLAFAWLAKRGVDPVGILTEKHEYNKTRPYKHGNKVC